MSRPVAATFMAPAIAGNDAARAPLERDAISASIGPDLNMQAANQSIAMGPSPNHH
jgi:hypothetical protein